MPRPGCKEIGFRNIYVFMFDTINEAHKQYSLLDTIFNYLLYNGSPGEYLCTSRKTIYPSAGFGDVGFGDLSIDMFLIVLPIGLPVGLPVGLRIGRPVCHPTFMNRMGGDHRAHSPQG